MKFRPVQDTKIHYRDLRLTLSFAVANKLTKFMLTNRVLLDAINSI